MKSELHFTIKEILDMEWITFYYWHRRALELFSAKAQRPFREIPESQDLKVDEDAFERQKKRLYAKIAKIEKEKEGTING